MKKSVCAYCGVGCRFDIIDDRLKADKSYPINQGMSCAKGISQTKTISTNRLESVKIRASISDEFQISTYDDALEKIAQAIKKSSPKRVGFYLSGQMLNEDYYVANKLAKGFIGTPNCDTNSRTCMASAVVGYKKSFGVDYVGVRVEDIDRANLLILIGSNVAESHVVLFNRIKKAQKRGLKVVVIDPRETLTSKIADLHIQLTPNRDIELLNLLSMELIKNSHIDMDFIEKYSDGFDEYKEYILSLDKETLLNQIGITKESFDALYALFLGSQKIITAWTMGINQSSQGVDKNLAINNLHIITGQLGKDGSGAFSLTGQPNAMGGREVGGLSTTLAVHLDYTPNSIEKVSKFWDSHSVPTEIGLTAFEMIEEANRGNIDILIIAHTDPIYHLPNQNFVKKAISKVPLVVELNAYDDSQTASFAHIRVPTKAFGEKEGTQTNMDRTLTLAEAFVTRDDILQDWEIFAMLAHKLGFGEKFAYKSSKDVFDEYKEMTRLSQGGHLDIYRANYDELKHTPFIWGVGLFDEFKFLTPNQKAKIHIVDNKNLSEQRSDKYPFILLTGRIRDQWHSGTKTRFVPTLLKHKELEFVEINPDDAKELNLSEDESVYIVSRRGKIRAKVKITNIKQKSIFVPISHRDINILTPSIIDNISKEPDYNHSAIYIEKI